MVSRTRRQSVVFGLGGAVVLAIAAWIVGGQIRSPAQLAADAAAPAPSSITVPVERRVLSSEVVVRGTVRYGSPQPVVLPTSDVKQTSSSGPVDAIVTVPPIRGSRVGEGSVAMTVSGRPVLVLRGAQPSHRDLGPGTRGPDVRQLETSLARMGFYPGRIDGRYDGQSASAVARWYESEGFAPFGPTDAQLDQLRAARAAANQARDAYLQSRLAARGTPGDIAQARIDLETARDTVDTAVHDVASQRGAISLAIANQKRDGASAAADVAAKRATLNKSRDALVEAQRSLAEAPPDTSTSERIALQAGVRAATDDVSVAQADLNASLASERATRAAGRVSVSQARADQRRTSRALRRSRRQVVLAERRLRILNNPDDTTLQRLVTANAKREARGAAADARRLARKLGITVPANEVLFFKTLPLRIDSVRSRRGDAVIGRVMTVANSRLAIDSSLSLSDAKLVRSGAQVEIEDADLGVKTTGTVSFVADRPGTHQVDPGRIYVEIQPKTAPAQLVGSSVKLTIAVHSTGKAVLAVPLTALSVGADGNARIQVERANGSSEFVTVNPGLSAQGLVEVSPVKGTLTPGDLVVVGAHGGGGTSTGPTGAAGSTGSSGGAAGGTGASGPRGATAPRPGTTPKDSTSTGSTDRGQPAGTTP